MIRNLSRVVPFLIVTIVVFGGVEQLYSYVDNLFSLLHSGQRLDGTGKGRFGSDIEKHQNYTVILKRNLFHSQTENNEHNSVAQEETIVLKRTNLELILVGTVTGEKDQDRAVIFDKQIKKQNVYYLGDEVQGASIKKILRGKVILHYNGNDEVLDLDEAREAFYSAKKLKGKKNVAGNMHGSSTEDGKAKAKDGAKQVELKEFLKQVPAENVKVLVKEN